jgi:hypothetical protein
LCKYLEGCGKGKKSTAVSNVLLNTSNDDIHFQYKVHGMEMEWKSFKPVFLCPPDAGVNNDLACLSSWGWHAQAQLETENMGLITVGREKYIVRGAAARTFYSLRIFVPTLGSRFATPTKLTKRMKVMRRTDRYDRVNRVDE